MTQWALLALILTLARVLPGSLDAQELQHTPQVLITSEGNSINITCSTVRDLLGLFLKKTWPESSNVIYFEDGEESTVDKHFSGRVGFSGSQKNLTISLRLLQPADTGVYTCCAVLTRGFDCNAFTTVVVKEACRSQEPLLTSISLPAALAVGFFFIGLVLGVLFTPRKMQIKKLCTSRDKDSRCVVYEDMSYSNRKTPCTPNHYQ